MLTNSLPHGGGNRINFSLSRDTVNERGEKKAASFPRSAAGEPVDSLTLRRPFRRREGVGIAVLCLGCVDSRASCPGSSASRAVASLRWENKWLRSPPSRRRFSGRRRGAVCFGPEGGWCGGGDNRVPGFCPPSSPSQRRGLRRRCGDVEALYRRLPGAVPGDVDGELLAQLLWWSVARRFADSVALLVVDEEMDLGLEGSGISSRPTSYNASGAAACGGQLLRTAKLDMAMVLFQVMGDSGASLRPAAEISGAVDFFQWLPRIFLPFSLSGGPGCCFPVQLLFGMLRVREYVSCTVYSCF